MALESDLVSELGGLFDDIDSGTDMEALREAIENGDLNGIERALNISDDDDTLEELTALFAGSALGAFDAAAEEELDIYNPASSGIREIVSGIATTAAVAALSQARQTMHGILQRGLQDGLTSDELAHRLHDEMWILDRHAAAMEARRQSMEEAGSSDTAIERAAQASLAGYLLYRITLVAATLITEAIRSAREWAWGILSGSGDIDPNRTGKKWKTAQDEKVCPICEPMDGVVVPLFEPFEVPGPPAHPICRCDIELVDLE